MAQQEITEPALEQLIREYESALRAGLFEGGALPPDWEAELARFDRSTAWGKLRYWGALKAYLFHTQQRVQDASSETDPDRIAMQLVRRDPVRVTLSNGRRISITGRSLSALIEMAAHEMRITELQGQIREGMQLIERLSTARMQASFRRARQIRRRIQRVEAALARSFEALVHHRERWLAHAATPNGAPAHPDDSPPPWCAEVNEVDWYRILAACQEAGPGRYGQLPEPPAPKTSKQRSNAENFGAISILSAWGVRIRVEPAELLEEDYGKLLMEMRAAAPPSLDDID